jgi:hypothetical protein
MGFLTTKELNWKQVKWAEILAEYHFKIKYIRGINNTKADILSRKTKLQNREKLLSIMLHINKDKKIRYNYPQISVVYKALIASWTQRI